ncbi:ABC transporter [Actinoplanes sp. OR16]|uniref:ABC transporter permease n=1 Tax=Actinoplanes sp. OR16 TaxID=946334 RepID=UPI000F6FDAF3|nr:ABC transporter permease [Actinoplanes sp. OR16]BBH67498.1 ABC transporter [Actinoplanes sp. OR16]
MRAYLRFELRRLLRDPRIAFFSIIGPVATYLIFSSWSGDDRLEGLAAPVAVMIGLACYGALAGVLMVGSAVSQERASGWLRQLRVTPLPAGRVVAVKALLCTATALPPVLAVGAAASFQHHVDLPAARWIAVLLLTWAGALPFALLGLAIGYGLSPQIAMSVNFLVFLALSVLGGLLAPADYFPDGLRGFAHLLPTYRYAELGWRSAAGEAPSLTGTALLVAWSAVFAVLAAVAYRRSTVRR